MMRAGQKYAIKINYDPEVDLVLRPRVHYVGVTTEEVETYCTFGAELK